jgi:hypothetical protein
VSSCFAMLYCVTDPVGAVRDGVRIASDVAFRIYTYRGRMSWRMSAQTKVRFRSGFDVATGIRVQLSGMRHSCQRDLERLSYTKIGPREKRNQNWYLPFERRASGDACLRSVRMLLASRHPV